MAYIGVPPADRTSGARVRDEFTADGTQVCFQLSQEVPGSFESNIIAVVENVIQEPVSAYTIIDTITLALTSISGTFTKNETVTGGTSAATGKVIQVNAGSIVITVTTGTFQTETITGGSSSATATISSRTTNIGRGLNLTGTPTNGSKIYVLHQASATYNLKPAAGSVTPDSLSENLRTFTVDKFTATSSQTAFTLSATPVSVKSILVFVDGVMQTETTHYTLSAATLTMGSALTTGQQVTVVHLGFSTVSRTAFPDASITTAMLADGAITADKIANGTIIAADVADGAITTAKLNSTLDLSGKTITYRSIVAGDLASNAITTAKITDANVTPAKLSTGAPTWNTAGQIGLGVSVSSWDSGTFNTQEFGYAGNALFGQKSAVQAGIGTNSYYNSGWKYANSSTPTNLYYQLNGVHTFVGAPSGTAGNAITYTQLLAIQKGYSIALEGASQQAGTGISFPASQSASSDANTLDDYEEGSWTPSFVGSSTNPTVVYGTRVGYYVKVGQMVYCTLRMNVTSTSGGSGNLYVSGMPFAQKTSTDQFATFSLGYHNAFATAAPTYGRWYGPGSAVFELYYMGGATTESAVNVTHLQSNTQLIISFVYQSAS
jgi:hypothetical protein